MVVRTCCKFMVILTPVEIFSKGVLMKVKRGSVREQEGLIERFFISKVLDL